MNIVGLYKTNTIYNNIVKVIDRRQRYTTYPKWYYKHVHDVYGDRFLYPNKNDSKGPFNEGIYIIVAKGKHHSINDNSNMLYGIVEVERDVDTGLYSYANNIVYIINDRGIEFMYK